MGTSPRRGTDASCTSDETVLFRDVPFLGKLGDLLEEEAAKASISTSGGDITSRLVEKEHAQEPG